MAAEISVILFQSIYTLLAKIRQYFVCYVEAVIAHPGSAVGATVELDCRICLCVLKSLLPIFRPEQSFFPVVQNLCHIAVVEGDVRASPFVSAEPAGEPKRKTGFVRVVFNRDSIQFCVRVRFHVHRIVPIGNLDNPEKFMGIKKQKIP